MMIRNLKITIAISRPCGAGTKLRSVNMWFAAQIYHMLPALRFGAVAGVM